MKVGVVPVQVPLVAVNFWPTCAVPVTVGITVLAGATGVIGPKAADAAVAEPAPFSAVISMIKVWPRSAMPGQ